jgi:hypothetical protein
MVCPSPTYGSVSRNYRIKVEALKRVPVPASDTKQKVRTYVERLPMPCIGGIAAGEALTVQWPTGLHALLAFVEPITGALGAFIAFASGASGQSSSGCGGAKSQLNG